jgi:type VI secretion system secreted protein VgrG
MMHLPRIGQEVLVAFLDSSPDQPVVVGRLYNQRQPVPYSLPDQRTRSAWKSDSVPGSGGFNELMFEDNKGDELVYHRAEKNRRKLIKHDEVITVGHDRTKDVAADEMDTVRHDRTEITGGDRSQTVVADRVTVIGGDRVKLVKGSETDRTEGDQVICVAGDRHLRVLGEKRERIEQDSHLHVARNRNKQVGGLSLGTSSYQVQVGKHFALESGDETHYACNEVLVGEAASDLTLKGPGGFIRIDGSGITIMGDLVLINVGGSSGSGSGAHPSAPREPKEAKVDPSALEVHDEDPATPAP